MNFKKILPFLLINIALLASCSNSTSSESFPSESEPDLPTETESETSESESEKESESEDNFDDILGPTLDTTTNTIKYGLYPQKRVADTTLINALNNLTTTENNGWYLYNNEYYTKEVAATYNNESFTFDDGGEITNGSTYWFKCEPISWNILKANNNTYTLISTFLLDNEVYNDTLENSNNIKANDYKTSDIRNFLNNSFLNKAFSLGSSHLLTKEVVGGESDKVYLPSKEDLTNSEYGFMADSDREAKTTDYARVRGSWANKDSYKNNGTYWTRTASEKYDYTVYVSTTSGFISEYAVNSGSNSVRPCISVKL